MCNRPKPSSTLIIALTTCICLAFLVQTAFAGNSDYLFKASAFGVSPDGSKLAYPMHVYDEYAEPVTQIWVAKLDGSGPKKIASFTGTWDIRWYDSSHLVRSEFNVDKLEIISLQGKSQEISLTDAYAWANPVVSPDGKWASFAARDNNADEMGIFLLDIKTKTIKKISSDCVKSNVSWSPDSEKLAYGVGNYQKDYNLKILDVATGKVKDTGLKGVGIDWSSDGKWLAYTGNVVRGGSWMYGIPIDGSIVKMNLQTGKTTVLTEPGINQTDKDTDRWEIAGSFDPKWSPDGKHIAFRHGQKILVKGNETLNEDEIWVMNADGSGAKKLFNEFDTFVWAPDSKAILVKTLTGINRISINTAKSTELVKWPAAVEPKPETKEMKVGSVSADYTGVKPEYIKALATIADEARKLYVSYGFDLPTEIEFSANRADRTQLWNDGTSHMFLTVTSNDALLPPDKSGTHNVFGMCHELGHMVMYRKIEMIGLPQGVGEGWADYVGAVLVDKIYDKFGQKLWPQPYDYRESDGTPRLKSEVADANAVAQSPDSRAEKVFWDAEQRYGEDKVMAAMKTALDASPMGKDVMVGFADALVKLTGDKTARKLVPDEMINPKLQWNVAERSIDEKTTAGEAQIKDDTGILLKYDDDKSDGMRSNAGSGDAVMFFAPAGSWAVDSIRIYGSRYGEAEPPKEDFDIFICDQDFNVIKTIKKPYSTFEREDPKWYDLTFDPVKVPQGFYVCVYFAPTATKGVYVHFDKNVDRSHSRYALPWTFVNDITADKYDWMIRAHLVKASE